MSLVQHVLVESTSRSAVQCSCPRLLRALGLQRSAAWSPPPQQTALVLEQVSAEPRLPADTSLSLPVPHAGSPCAGCWALSLGIRRIICLRPPAFRQRSRGMPTASAGAGRWSVLDDYLLTCRKAHGVILLEHGRSHWW